MSSLATKLRMWSDYDLRKQKQLLVRMGFFLVDCHNLPEGALCADTYPFCVLHMCIVVVFICISEIYL
jgi:hypothetical protein